MNPCRFCRILIALSMNLGLVQASPLANRHPDVPEPVINSDSEASENQDEEEASENADTEQEADTTEEEAETSSEGSETAADASATTTPEESIPQTHDEPTVTGHTISWNGMTYTITSDTTVQLTSTGTLTHVAVPKEISADGKTWQVTSLGPLITHSGSDDYSYPPIETMDLSACTGLTVIPLNVFSTGAATHALPNLTSVILPETIQTIEKKAFQGCRQLHSINFPASLTSIQADAFYITGLSDIDLSNCTLLTVIPDSAFSHASQYDPMSSSSGTCLLPPNLQRISLNAFSNSAFIFENFSSLDQLSTIEEGAFSSCSPQNWVFPANVKTVGPVAFATMYSPYSSFNLSLLKTDMSVANHAFGNDAKIMDPDKEEAVKIIMPDDPNVTITFMNGALANPYADSSPVYLYVPANYSPEKISSIEAQPGVSSDPHVKVVTVPRLSLSEDTDDTRFPDKTSNVMTYQDGSWLKAGPSPIKTITIKDRNGVTVLSQTYEYALKGDPSWLQPLKQDTSSLDLSSLSAGTYTATAENYGGFSNPDPFTFEIRKAAPDWTKPGPLQAVYGQSLGDIPLPEGFSWQDAEDTPVGDVGTKTFKAVFTPEDSINYETVRNIEVTVNVVPTDNAWTVDPDINGWIYSEQPNTPEAAARYGTPEFRYAADPAGPYTNTVPVNAGTYYLKADVEATANYDGLESSAIEFTIEPKELNDSNTSIPTITDKTDLNKIPVQTGDVVLKAGTDYTVARSETNGKVIVTFTFINNYKGSIIRICSDLAPDSGTAQKPQDPDKAGSSDKNTPTAVFTGRTPLLAATLTSLALAIRLMTRRKTGK